MPSSSTPDVLIVGGGAVGVATALALAHRDLSVSVVEAQDGTGRECSYGNSGLIAPSHCIPLAAPGLVRRIPGWLRSGGSVHVKIRPSLDFVRFGLELVRSCGRDQMLLGLRTLRDLSRASQEILEAMVSDGLDAGYERRGVLNVCRTQSAFEALRRDAELLRQEGFEPQILDVDGARRIEPCLRSSIAGAVYWDEDGHCDPRRLVGELTRLATESGVSFETSTRVTAFHRTNDGRIASVETTRTRHKPRAVVLAAGSWTSGLARLAGTRIPLEPGKGYHVHFRHDAPAVKIPMIFQESVFAATPMSGELRLAGTMEFVGLDAGLPTKATDRLLQEARLYLEGLDTAATPHTWCGFRPCTPDSLPLVGLSGRISNLYFATGHGMLGLTLAAVTGRAIAELLVDGRTELSIEPLSPARYRA